MGLGFGSSGIFDFAMKLFSQRSIGILLQAEADDEACEEDEAVYGGCKSGEACTTEVMSTSS